MSISDDVSMFYKAKPHIFDKAKTLRLNMTDAEKLLWEKLRNKLILGLRFRAQHPIDRFIADFYCHKVKLVIELDGGVHIAEEQKLYDNGRTAEMEEYGIKVIRFTNHEIFKDLANVIIEIEKICNERLTPPFPQKTGHQTIPHSGGEKQSTPPVP